jgi:histidinol-phosphatase (PHP family)
MLTDGHIHTPFCPHGSKDSFEEYIERAIELGFIEISFTEHAPLPKNFQDPTPEKDSAMRFEDVDEYISILTTLKEKYVRKIKINIGFEIDFIEGFEEETKKFLQTYGPKINDSILSVHFLKYNERYFCLDFSPETFGEMVEIFGSISSIHRAYYQTVLASIQADLGEYKPKRIGHITLVNKFRKKFPCRTNFQEEILTILTEMKKRGYQLDYNGAGTAKPLCQETYPPDWVIKLAIKHHIPIVYGSDAHSAKDLGQGFHQLLQEVTLSSPTNC